LVRRRKDRVKTFEGIRALDAGCGEGKNALCISADGAEVLAVDVSHEAITNAVRAWGCSKGVTWVVADIRNMDFARASFDVVVAYGLLHCLASQAEISMMITR